MTEAKADLQLKQTKAQRADSIMMQINNDGALFSEDFEFLSSYFELLHRQAAKASNRKKALADLHKHHNAVIMENRWMREAAGHLGGMGTWAGVLQRSKETLWSMFRRHYKSEVKDALEWLTNVSCGVGKSGGVVDLDEREAAVKTAQRVLGREGL